MKTGLEQQIQIQVSRETPEKKNMQKKKQFCPLYSASTSSTRPLGSTQKTSSQTELKRRFKHGGSDTTNHPASPCAPPRVKPTGYAWATENFNPSPDGSTGKYRRKRQQAPTSQGALQKKINYHNDRLSTPEIFPHPSGASR